MCTARPSPPCVPHVHPMCADVHARDACQKQTGRLQLTYSPLPSNEMSRRYQFGSSGQLLYSTSGTTDDWGYGVAGIKHSYGSEARDKGAYGFLIPPSLIKESAQEYFAGLYSLGEHVLASDDGGGGGGGDDGERHCKELKDRRKWCAYRITKRPAKCTPAWRQGGFRRMCAFDIRTRIHQRRPHLHAFHNMCLK